MFVSLIGRFQEHGEVKADLFAAWSAALRRLQDDWRRGERPEARRLRDYLQGVGAQDRAEALQDLIAAHLRLAWQAGPGTMLEAYLAEFGGEFRALSSPAAVPADLIEDEFLARHLLPYGDAPSLDEYERRFPGRPEVMKLLDARCLDGGRYVKLEEQGRGPFGQVWEACDRHLRRSVAIKELRSCHAGNAGILRSFADEARVTAGLDHPGIASVHEYRHPSGAAPFYVMRLVRGCTLGECIREYHRSSLVRPPGGERRLLWNGLLGSMAAACEAIACAHAGGVVHLDLKPGNIVCGNFGETVVLDWGAGIRLGGGSSRLPDPPQGAAAAPPSGGRVAGTPEYMAPEQVDGRVDERTDIFLLGATLFEMLAGRPPRAWDEGSRPADWPRIVREADFPAPRRLKPDSPRELEAICLKAMARSPAERYRSAADLAQDLRRYLAGEPVAAFREPIPARIRRWLRRRLR